MRNTKAAIGVLGAAAAVATAGLFAKKPAPEKEAMPPVTATAASALPIPTAPPLKTSFLRLVGTIQPEARAALSVRIPSKILSVLVQEGQHVSAGQRLIVLDESEINAQEKTAQAGVRSAQAQLQKAILGKEAQRLKADTDLQNAETGLKTARAKLDQAKIAKDALASDVHAERILADEGVKKAQLGLQTAQKTLASLEVLDRVGGVSRNDLEGARTQLRAAQSDLNTAQEGRRRMDTSPDPKAAHSYRLALAQKDVEAAEAGVTQAKAGVTSAGTARHQVLALADSDLAAARAGITQAEAGSTGAAAALRSSQFTTPVSGTVTGITAKAGEIAQPGVPLLTVNSAVTGRIEALATSRQQARLRVGQSASVTGDGLPSRPLLATLTRISSSAEPDGRTCRVVFSLPADIRLPPGASVFIEVLPGNK